MSCAKSIDASGRVGGGIRQVGLPPGEPAFSAVLLSRYGTSYRFDRRNTRSCGIALAPSSPAHACGNIVASRAVSRRNTLRRANGTPFGEPRQVRPTR